MVEPSLGGGVRSEFDESHYAKTINFFEPINPSILGPLDGP